MGLDQYLYAQSAARREEVAYWRKANQIHNWFVRHVQAGQDDCRKYPVEREQLEELVQTCKGVIENSPLRKGKILVSTIYNKGKERKVYETGLILKDPSLAASLLPTVEGFFFGGTGYDEYYIKDLQDTVSQIGEALERFEGKSWQFYYQSSW